MKRSIARKWAQALESGEYKQCKGKLREGDSFCCLGVLCNLHAQEHPEIAVEQTKTFSYIGETGILPEEVQAWAGMFTRKGTREDGLPNLAELNDYYDKSFPEIAKVIRKEWKSL